MIIITNYGNISWTILQFFLFDLYLFYFQFILGLFLNLHNFSFHNKNPLPFSGKGFSVLYFTNDVRMRV